MRRSSAMMVSAIVAAASVTAVAGYVGLVTGAIPVDLGIGRRRGRLGSFAVDINAPRETVFEILAAPYLGRQTRALAEKIHILERGTDMVLAAHRTHIRGCLVATTVETVRCTRPNRIDFRLVRGPVPEVTETFHLIDQDGATRLEYEGMVGTDLWAVGAWWGRAVADRWREVVADTFAAVKTEAERRSRHA